MPDALLDYLPKDRIIAAFERSPGNELGSGKFASLESSAALAANTFGFFLDQPEKLPPIPNTVGLGWPAISVAVEECAPFPWWPRGRHPWLDAMVETETHLIGVESKRYEPFRVKKTGQFSEAYWRPVWGGGMGPYEAARDLLANGGVKFLRLDGVQLVKHAFGLVTEARRRGKAPALVYLYAEPEAWPNGKLIAHEAKEEHLAEVNQFAALISGAEVAFTVCTYRNLLSAMRSTSDPKLQFHADNLARTFEV